MRRKLVVVNGDLGLPGLGLSAEDRRTLCREVHYVVHSAASISFVEHIHRLIAHNYVVRALHATWAGVALALGCASFRALSGQATRNMAELASEMRQIRSFLHVSTAYVNCHLGRGAHVEEQRYPITLDGRRMAHAEVAAELAALAPDVAERRVCF